jgi:hypothetical protein
MTQTAVEFLESKIFGTDTFSLSEVFEQAKEMEKQQIIDAWNDGGFGGGQFTTTHDTAEQYYNETFNK